MRVEENRDVDGEEEDQNRIESLISTEEKS